MRHSALRSELHYRRRRDQHLDVNKKTMTVAKNGRTLRTLQISSGEKGFETWNGTVVVLGQVPTIRMNSSAVGIFGPEA
ncbi:L,D-transpeptidase [Streptomyces hokutonensis]|uniref:L,D-transpeptidase n=1 Tax=Streptomyces hokutonensis TaxID=1306990 RepID=UPI0036919ECB